MKSKYYVGIDFHKNTSDICVLDSQGTVTERAHLRSELLCQYFSNKKDRLVGVEVSGGTHHLVGELKKLGIDIRLINPVQLRGIGIRGKKNDREDAEVIARALWLGQIPEVHHKQESTRQLKALLKSRDFLVSTRTQMIAHVRSMLREFGVLFPTGVEAFLKGSSEGLEKIEFTPLRVMLSQMVEEIKSKKTQEEEINELLYTLTKSDELVQRMVEVPGVGLLTAVALVTTLEDPHRFKNAGDLSGFLGMVPREFSSGAKKRLGGITKAGPQLLRKYLIHGARATMRYRPSTEHKQRLWAEKLSQRSGVNKATVALARKTAIILWAMWRDETKYNEKKTEQKPEQKTEQKEIQRKVA